AYANATWRDLLAAIGTESGRSVDAWGRQYILRPGIPVIDQIVRTDKAGNPLLILRQRPAQSLSGKGAWPVRTSVVVGTQDGVVVRVPATLATDSVVVRLPRMDNGPGFVY